MKIACIGEAMIELSIRDNDTKLGVAGDTLNTAVYLKRSAPQIEVDYITRLGSDPFSDQITSFIKEQNLGTGAIEISDDRHPGLYAITTAPDGENDPLLIGEISQPPKSCSKAQMVPTLTVWVSMTLFICPA